MYLSDISIAHVYFLLIALQIKGKIHINVVIKTYG
jgi:hypothetical protein